MVDRLIYFLNCDKDEAAAAEARYYSAREASLSSAVPLRQHRLSSEGENQDFAFRRRPQISYAGNSPERNGQGAARMMRTIWLALTCLIGLGTLTAVKVSLARPANQVASATGQVEADLRDPLAKGDKLPLSYAEPPLKIPIQSVPIAPSVVAAPKEASQRIISRHWHEGDQLPGKQDKRMVRSEVKSKQ